MSLLDFSTSNTQTVDEIINVADANPVNLSHDIIYNKAGKLVSIWTGAGSTGTELTDGSDYDIGDVFPDGSLPVSISPDVAYTTVAVTNATYQGVALYVSYYPVGDIISAARWNSMSPVPTPPYDISAANTVITLPTITGYAQKYTYFWTGGDGSNTLSLAVTDGATVGGLSAGTWLGEGTGHIKVISDGTNWQVSEYEDSGSNGVEKWYKYGDGTLQQYNVLEQVAAGNTSNGTLWVSSLITWTYLIPFIGDFPIASGFPSKILVNDSGVLPISIARLTGAAQSLSELSGFFLWYAASSATVENQVDITATGRWRT
jgi:hypothetical protein